MTVRELVAKFGLDIRGADFKRADHMVNNLKKSALALGSLWASSKVVQGARRLAQETAELGDGLNALSARSGVAIGAIQELRYVGEAAGLAVGQVDGAIFRLSRRMGAALQGNRAMADAFARAGVSIRDASGQARAAEDVMMDLADRMAAMSSEGERAAVGMQLMGDTGIAMAAALAGGSAEVMRLRQEARELGLMEQELADQSSRLVMTQQRLRYSIRAIRLSIASVLVPWINEAAAAWLRWQRANSEWLKLKIEQAVKAVAAALRVLANISRFVVRSIESIGSALGGLAKGLTVAALAAGALVVAFGLKAAAIALVLLLFEDFIAFVQGKESVIGRLSERIKKMWSDFLARDYDFSEHPVLALLQGVARAIDTVIDAWRRLVHAVLGPDASLLAKSMESSISSVPILGGLFQASKLGTITADANLAGQTRRHWEAQGFELGPREVQPSAGGATTNNNISVDVELNFTPADGMSPQSIEESVRRGVGGALRDATRGLSPAYSGLIME